MIPSNTTLIEGLVAKPIQLSMHTFCTPKTANCKI